MFDCRPIDGLMGPNHKQLPNQGEPHSDLERYRRLVEKFIYLAITRLVISFAIGVVSQFMEYPHTDDHWDLCYQLRCYSGKLRIRGAE